MNKISHREISKVVDWLSELSGHGIYVSASLKFDFLETVGIEAPIWPEHTYEQIDLIMAGRGLGGEMPVNIGEKYANGYEVARALSWEYAGTVSDKVGRGSSFWDHINALRNLR